MKRLLPTFLLLLMVQLGFAQSKQITGSVIGAADQLPLPGVSVVIQGTYQGTTTDIDGNYVIDVEGDNVVLEFSFIGMKSQAIAVDGKSRIDVSMAVDAEVLEDVVVIGYGVQKKSVVTGAISSISPEEVEGTSVMRVEDALQGRVSGVQITRNSGQPGAASTVRIRGVGTINNSNPLYVVDGMPVEGGIDYIPPSDIESMEVLKDGASAAIYGSRAANGVILITTKKGKEGKMNLSYDMYYGGQNPWKQMDVLNANEYAVLMNEGSMAAGRGMMFDGTTRNGIYFPSVAEINAKLGQGTDWQDAVFNRNAPIQSHDVKLTGGSATTHYLLGMGYFGQDGIVGEGKSNYERISTRFNFDHTFRKILKVGANFAYTHVESQGVEENSEFGSPLGRALNMDPITKVYEDDPDRIAQIQRDAATRQYNIAPILGNSNGIFGISPYVTSEVLNPVAALYLQNQANSSDKIVGNIFAELDLGSMFKFRTSYGVDLAFWDNRNFSPTQYLNSTNVVPVNSVTSGRYKAYTTLWENVLMFNKTWADKHNVSALGGITVQEGRGEDVNASGKDLQTNDFDDAWVGSTKDLEARNSWGGQWQHALMSYVGRVTYDYDEKYLFNFTFRVDGSTRFSDKNQFATFPSVAVGWVMTQEDFMQNVDWLTFMKLRASWGQNGNERIGDFRYTSVIANGNNYTFGSGSGQTIFNGAKPSVVSNPDLKWETTTQTNIGLDLRFVNNIRFGFDWFHKKTVDMLMEVPIPAYVGNGRPIVNAGDMLNTGVELELGWDKQWGDLGFSVSGNASYLNNEILYLGNESGYIDGQRYGPQGLLITRNQEGYPLGSFYGYVADGIFQNVEEVNAHSHSDGSLKQPDAMPGDVRFKDLNNDGIIDDADRQIIGNSIPDWTFGLNIGMDYKGFDLGMFFQGVVGNEIFNATRRYDLPTSNLPATALGRWTGEGTSNTLPRMNHNDLNRNYRSSSLYVEDGSYLRLKNLQLGYSFPKRWISKIAMERLRIYVSSDNVFTITDYTGFDPEIGGWSFGVDRGNYPQARTILGGLQLSF